MKDFYFGSNLRHLRELRGLKQAEMQAELGIKHTTWNGYEKNKSLPKVEDLVRISEYFGFDETALLKSDLSNVHLNEKGKGAQNVHPIVHPSVHLNPQKGPKSALVAVQREVSISVLHEEPEHRMAVPMVDISVAAGYGALNTDYVENAEYLTLPKAMVKKKKGKYLAVRVKGDSMAPTLLDNGFVAVRQLERQEWAEMPDGSVFVVVDREGKAFLKRIRNRLSANGFLVLTSDSPDKVRHPNFNLLESELSTIWEAELYLTAEMPNVHDTYYNRLQQLEDRMEELVARLPVKRK